MGYQRIKALFTGQKYHQPEKDIPSKEKYLKNIKEFERNKIAFEIMDFLNPEKKSHLVFLDIAGLYSWFSVCNARKFPASIFISLDLLKNHLKIAQQERSSKNIYYIVADAKKIPLTDESCHFILIYNAFEHFENPEKILLEAVRVLKKNGKIFLTAPNKFGRGHLDSTNLGKVKEFSYFELKKLFKKIGLSYFFIPPKIKKGMGLSKKFIIKLLLITKFWKIFKPSSFRIILQKMKP